MKTKKKSEGELRGEFFDLLVTYHFTRGRHAEAEFAWDRDKSEVTRQRLQDVETTRKLVFKKYDECRRGLNERKK